MEIRAGEQRVGCGESGVGQPVHQVDVLLHGGVFGFAFVGCPGVKFCALTHLQSAGLFAFDVADGGLLVECVEFKQVRV